MKILFALWCAQALLVLPRAPRRPRPLFAEKDDEPRQVPEQPQYEVEPIFADFNNPVTLTFLGFGLIAFNFFVLANL